MSKITRDQKLVNKLTVLAERGATAGERDVAQLFLNRVLIRLQGEAVCPQQPAVASQYAYPMPARSDQSRSGSGPQPVWDQYYYDSIRVKLQTSHAALLRADIFADSAMLKDHAQLEAELNRLNAVRLDLEKNNMLHLSACPDRPATLALTIHRPQQLGLKGGRRGRFS